MAPGTRRSLIKTVFVFGSTVVMLPVAAALSSSAIEAWLAVALLAVSAFLLFRRRAKLRTAFLIPIVWIPLIGAFRFRYVQGIGAPGFTICLFVFLATFVAAMVVDAFWKARSDDLADLEYFTRLRE